MSNKRPQGTYAQSPSNISVNQRDDSGLAPDYNRTAHLDAAYLSGMPDEPAQGSQGSQGTQGTPSRTGNTPAQGGRRRRQSRRSKRSRKSRRTRRR